MTYELTKSEFENTFGNKMTDITPMEIEEPIDIWDYVRELTEKKVINQITYESETVEYVYRNDQNTYDHILLPTDKENIYIVIVINLKMNKIFGHQKLDLNKKYPTE
ncbi:hypothetical protein [Cellulophaga sp. Hel_I_12]|uniref:hypothetical protein n=1 Tax=Cellulophaga sp. Hel_I_12 TaxID=1249972 RepID=UPI000647616B|nr:hypothetical protein [Cellulophaga sp. Hel_I_12]